MQYTNYEKMKIFVVNTWLKILFAIHELWKQENICITWIIKTLNVYLQYMNYENICLQCKNYEMSIWNTWIMKIGKYMFAINELWKS